MVNPRLVVTCLALVAGLAQPAEAAAPEKFDTKVTLKVDMTPRAAHARGTFSWEGRVKSPKDACEKNRVVTLWTVPEAGPPPQNRGESVTGSDGKYAVIVEANFDGEYYAEAAKRTLGNGNVCKFGRSESIFRDNIP